MAFTRSGVRSPSPPLADRDVPGRTTDGRSRRRAQLHCSARGNSSVGRAQPCQGWGRGFESRFPLSQTVSVLDTSDAGWSSLVARRAHNPEVVGSNPTPAIADGKTERWTDGTSAPTPSFHRTIVPSFSFQGG